MLNKFVQGLVFGLGFGIALVTTLIIGTYYIMPSVLETKLKDPQFSNPHKGEIAVPERTPSAKAREYSFFKGADHRMQIPEKGGILSLSLLPTDADAIRPRTFQLWLTASELWKIRTDGEAPDVEKIPYPESNPVEYLEKIMRESVGFGSGQGTMTVSAETIAGTKTGLDSCRENHLNGKLKITTEGVVFLLPNPYGT